MPSWNDQQRSDLLARYRQSGLTQTAFCAELRLAGIDLSPRTLRSWMKRLEPPEGVIEECRQAVDNALSELHRVRAMLATLCSEEKERHASPVELGPIEPEPPTEAGLPVGILETSSLEARPPPPTVPTRPVPGGIPTLAPRRRVPRITWG
jgi:hypothetical protein